MRKNVSGKHSAHPHTAVVKPTAQIDKKEGGPVGRSNLYKVIVILCVVVFILVAIVLGVFLHNRQMVREEYEALQETVRREPLPTVEALSTVEPLPAVEPEPAATPRVFVDPTPVPVEIPVDLSYLQSLNSDVIGWIWIEGTGIDYPVLYDDTDNSYYIDHTRTGKYAKAGSIFVQDINEWDFSDFNTVLYGHNMGDGSMFAHLHRFEKESFFNDYDTVVVYTEDSVLTYKIFAAYVRDNEHLMKYYSYDTKADREAYIDDIYSHDGLYRDDVDVTADDRIISLSTCTGWTYTRLVVQGVLISEEPGIYVSD